MRKLALVLTTCLFATLASAQVRSLGPVSFFVPDGMTYEEQGGRAAMSKIASQDDFVIVAITEPVPSVGDADANFRSVWTQIAQTAPPTAYSIRPKGGYGGRYGATNCKPKMNCILFTLETGKGIVPVFALIPERQPEWSFFDPIHQSVRLSPAKAQAPKKTIFLADMAGKWGWGASSSMVYVNSSGNYAGSSTSAVSSTYTIASDGAYTVSSSGLSNNRTFREQASGRIELTPDAIVFHEKEHGDKRYRFVSYVTAIDGSTIMTLLNASYEPTPQNISMYGEDFVRPPG